VIPFEEDKYHYYVRVIDTDLLNGVCVLVLALVLAEVVNDLTVSELYSFVWGGGRVVVVFCCSS
jgi:hypothetical protein